MYHKSRSPYEPRHRSWHSGSLSNLKSELFMENVQNIYMLRLVPMNSALQWPMTAHARFGVPVGSRKVSWWMCPWLLLCDCWANNQSSSKLVWDFDIMVFDLRCGGLEGGLFVCKHVRCSIRTYAPLTHGDMARQLESGSTLCEAAAVVHVLSYMQQWGSNSHWKSYMVVAY